MGGSVNRFAPNCCPDSGDPDPDCTYAASDGTLYSNAFGAALDAGWTQTGGFDLTFATASGRLQGVGTVGGGHGEAIYRSDTLPGTWTRIIHEVDVIPYDGFTIITAIQLLTTAGNSMGSFQARWSTGDFRCVSGSTSNVISQTPVTGDTLSTIVTKEGSDFRACFFVNGTEINNILNTVTSTTDPFRHNVFLSITPNGSNATYGEFDNYTIQLDS